MESCEVTRADQQLINRFARLNAKAEELDLDLKERRRQLANARDALDELALHDDHVLLHCGDVLARLPLAEAERWCEELRDQLEQGARDLERRLAAMRAQMTDIKATLYGKFGQNINLEYEDDEA